jgi:ribulose 1,5-bisphosphate carboxylase large subunit-like protein
LGLSAKNYGRAVYECLRGGLDFTKDDLVGKALDCALLKVPIAGARILAFAVRLSFQVSEKIKKNKVYSIRIRASG